MANLLADPNVWSQNEVSPPPFWNGTAYAVSFYDASFEMFLMFANAPAPANATIAGTAFFESNTLSDITLILEDGALKVTFDSVQIPANVATPFSMEGPEGEYLALITQQVYGLKLTLTPGAVAAPPVVGPNSITVDQDSSGTPVSSITISGSIDSVAIASQPTHGTAAVSGLSFIYTPTAGYTGPDSFTYTGTNADGTSAPATITVLVVADLSCEELGRVTRCYVSAYQRDRVHRSSLVRGERRCLVANFNGAIPTSRTIQSVTWKTNQPYAANMSSARVDGREATVTVDAQYGCAQVKCQVTLDNGERYNQLFDITVRDAPYFSGDQPYTSGPYELTATA